jgi:hypothetical protein
MKAKLFAAALILVAMVGCKKEEPKPATPTTPKTTPQAMATTAKTMMPTTAPAK